MYAHHYAGSDITNTGSDVTSHVIMKQSPTIWHQKVKIVPPSPTHRYRSKAWSSHFQNSKTH